MKANEGIELQKEKVTLFARSVPYCEVFSLSYNKKDTGHFTCWFTDNSPARRMQKTVLLGPHAWDQSLFVKRTPLHRKS